MERVLETFTNHADAQESDRRYYASLKPQERLEVLLDLISQHREALGETAERFEKVYRVTTLSGR